MPDWSHSDLRKHMHVYSSDNQDLGHIAEIYEDSFEVHKGAVFHNARYIPYGAISSIDVENNHVLLSMMADEAKNMEWEIRPAYEQHSGDPTQLMYDRGHGVHDPF